MLSVTCFALVVLTCALIVKLSRRGDRCWTTVDVDECAVLCQPCAKEKRVNDDALKHCSPVFIQGKYTCINARCDFEWRGELPEFCPRCGREIRK